MATQKKSVDDIKKEYQQKVAELRKATAEKIKQQKALENRKKQAEKTQLRKAETHLKCLVGGYVFASKNVDIVRKLLETKTVRPKDAENLRKLIDSDFDL